MTYWTKQAVDNARDIALLKMRLALACTLRDMAIIQMHEMDGIPKSRVSDKLRGRLALGDDEHSALTEDQIEGLGVSEWSVRRVFDKAREKEDNSVNANA